MPELPEVEVVCRGLAPHLCGRVARCWWTSGVALRRPLPESEMARWLTGRRFEGVFRRAKYVVMALDNGAWLIVHLGMSGRLGLFAAQESRRRHDHFCLLLDNGMELRFNDPRRFGMIHLAAPGTGEAFFAASGIEPFSRAFTGAALAALAARRGRPVKNFLMDGRMVAGIGNIYANEILHQAGISPLRPARDLEAGDWERVVRAGREVLRRAIAAGGSTIADFVGSSGEKGYFQLQLRVYGREGEPCACGGTVNRCVLAGRATYFCPRCQK